MRMLAGILPPTGGRAEVAGFDVARASARVHDRIAYMSQQFGLYPDLSVLENIEFYADLYGVPRRGRAARIDELLSFSYMQPFKQRLAGKLSGGMKQKLQLVTALIHQPEVLLLDEPTNGVDPLSRRDFWRILYDLLRDGVTIFVSTAYLDEAERCNRLALMHGGEVIGLGTPAEVKHLMAGAILSITSRHARAILHHLRDAAPALRPGLFGDRVHVVVDDPKAARRELEAMLTAAGLEFSAIKRERAGLEDVFVSVIGADEARGEEAAHA
jgi:ABC-2 type transport system ATP-binding protein